MKGNADRVRLDLNFPLFQEALFDLDVPEVKKIFKTLKKLSGVSWNELFRDHGLKWEEIRSAPGKYTLRLSQSYRAVVVRDNGLMRFQALHLDHDRTYGKK